MEELKSKYLEQMEITGEEYFSFEKANEMMNDNVMSYYKNRVSLRENRYYSGEEIAEKLAFIEDNFKKQFEKSFEEEFGEDY